MFVCKYHILCAPLPVTSAIARLFLSSLPDLNNTFVTPSNSNIREYARRSVTVPNILKNL